MPIKFYADPDHPDIFHWKFTGRWTPEEFFPLNAEANRQVSAIAPTPVYEIVDMRESGPLPPNILGVLTQADMGGVDNWTMSVIVSESGLYKIILNVAHKVYPRLSARFQLVYAVDDAMRIIEEARANACTNITN